MIIDHVPDEHGCPCSGCKIAREHASKALPEHDVHWPWLHGDTPPGTALSPREAFERTHAHIAPRFAGQVAS